MATLSVPQEVLQQALDALKECNGNKSNAARKLGISRSTFLSRLDIAQRHSSVAHLAPMIPDGQKLRGVSTLYDMDGNARLQWIKTKEDLDRTLEIIKEAAEALTADIPKEKATKFQGHTESDLVSNYVLTDYHLGQMSWAGETGEDWNTEKASDFLVKWFEKAIQSAPASEVGVLCQLGDFLHFDSLQAVTPTSKHLMDTDARYAQLVHAAIKALRKIINMLLKKHKRVHIIMAEGNHDIASSVWLRALFSDKYENEPRVTVDNSALPYYVFEWGDTLLLYHHGHLKKMESISRVFAGMFREQWGKTKFAYGHMGHYHHIKTKEDELMIIRQHPTMAPHDAYSARGGYLAMRSASVTTYSKKYGQVSDISITPEMIK